MDSLPKLSITLIGHNEAYHLEELLPTLAWADEVIYVDCESSDNSIQVATQFHCRIFKRPNNPNLNINKSFGMENASGEWIFYLDPDERISGELTTEIRSAIANPGNKVAFSLNRRNYYFGRWLRYGSQYPDSQLRLFKRGHAVFPQKHVHEKLQIAGPIGKLQNDLYHRPYLSVSQYLQKFDFYTSFEANYLLEQGVKPGFGSSFHYWIERPLLRFIRRYFFKQGFRDGWPGFFAALFDSLNFMVRYFKLRELQQKQDNKSIHELS